MIRSMSYSRYFMIPTPIDTGSAAAPSISTTHSEELVAIEAMRNTPQAAAPLISHFSCCRRSPEDRRQLSTWRHRAATQLATSPARNRAPTLLVQARPPAGFCTCAS